MRQSSGRQAAPARGWPIREGARLPSRAAIVCALATLILLAPASRVVAEPSRDPARAPAGGYVLDPRRSSLTVKLAYLGGLTRSTVRFTRLSGGFAYDPATWRSTRVSIAVDPASAESVDRVAGRRVKSALEPEKHPVIRFTSNGVAGGADGRGRLEGDLTLHGVTRPILLDIVFDGVGAEPRLRFSGGGRIKRSDFGVTAARPFVGDMLDLAFEVEFVRKQAGP
ncbi:MULTISPECIES: YceI family protein [unclassified Phenylobacterium]|uniref:YceI family protein n=1 Tax=unclassified Phenylobacterium TaxID=2640670 RepID=UPI00083ACA67|nr:MULTISPECIES: YceI family protein [unclassified Phenylobacterium]